ncbi:MAG: translation initiation factor IF-3 [Ignavibacteriales bacterium]|nr:translation initiation factor IF-3 [Ignavibacteriales bacterium]MCF8314536.1 translation initiation factor IF-3 [Ignavibacteriales bacterium]MCF8436427.1 translation initiation factor IF-3 [Ignavibacteriales bacterium]
MSTQKYRVNQEIRTPKVRLIDADGKQLGIVGINEAINQAVSREMDIVEIAPQADPPVCKVIDYGKFVYELQKKEKLQRKNQQTSILKEIRLHPNTDTHDFEFKARHAINFVEEGNKVKVAVIFKGRELTYKEHGEELLKRFIEKMTEVAKVEQDINFEGRTMTVILAPLKSKKKK